MHSKLLLIGSALISISLLSSETSAQHEWIIWAPENGVAIRQGNAVGWNRAVASRSDGDQSTAIVWEDTREGSRTIAMQILESDGTPRFDNFGKLIIPPSGYRSFPSVCPAPDNGWFVVWVDISIDYRQRVRCAKIAADGHLLWRHQDGAVDLAENSAYYTPKVFSDGSDGCIVLWKEVTQPHSALVATHVLNDGSVDENWNNGRLVVTPENFHAGSPHAITDSDGGIFIAWQHFTGVNYCIAVQHLTAEGALDWNGGNPVIIREQSNQSDHFDLSSDGQGGLFFAWTDFRNYRQNYRDVFAQRIDSDGNAMWQAEGEPLANDRSYEQNPRIINSGEGEAIVLWEIIREDDNIDIRAMKICGEDQMRFL